MKYIKYIIIFLVFYSCRNEAGSTKQITTEHQKELIIKIGLKTSIEDEFKVMLNNIKVDEFQRKNIHIREVVPPSSDLESIVANFGHDFDTKNLIINLGKKEKTVEFNGIEVSYGQRNILITNSNFNKFFKINKFIERKNREFIFITKKINGKHNPLLIARKKLIDSLFN